MIDAADRTVTVWLVAEVNAPLTRVLVAGILTEDADRVLIKNAEVFGIRGLVVNCVDFVVVEDTAGD